MAKAVRMSDIAEKLEISTVSVSKALSGQKGVSEEMRQRIRETADAMGYVSPAAGKPEEKRSYNIGMLVSEVYIEKYNTFYWELYQAISTRAVKENCFVMLEVLSAADEKVLAEPKLVRENKIDGLMILGSMQRAYLGMLQERCPLPVVYVDFYDSAVGEDSIISNSFYGTYALTNYLFDKGHKDIAFVGTLLCTESITDRYLGYLKSLLAHGCKSREDWILHDRDEKRCCFESIELPKKMPTAFVCNCDLTASKLIRSLREAGYRVPEDVSVVGYDDYLYPGLCDVGITTYAVDMPRMAGEGIRTLLGKMSGEDYQIGMHVVAGYLVERESVRKLEE